jgi:hypothetical protein
VSTGPGTSKCRMATGSRRLRASTMHELAMRERIFSKSRERSSSHSVSTARNGGVPAGSIRLGAHVHTGEQLAHGGVIRADPGTGVNQAVGDRNSGRARRSDVPALNVRPQTATAMPSSDPPAAAAILATIRSCCWSLTLIFHRG